MAAFAAGREDAGTGFLLLSFVFFLLVFLLERQREQNRHEEVMRDKDDADVESERQFLLTGRRIELESQPPRNSEDRLDRRDRRRNGEELARINVARQGLDALAPQADPGTLTRLTRPHTPDPEVDGNPPGLKSVG